MLNVAPCPCGFRSTSSCSLRAAELTVVVRILHDLLDGLSVLLLLSCDHFALHLLDICIGSGTGWLDCCSLTLHSASLSYFALSRSQSFGCFACRWLCSCLACRWLCSSGCCWLCSSACGSSRFILSPLLDVERCSASASSLRCSSRCPRTRVALFRSSRHWLVGRGSVSDFHHLLLGCGSFCTSLSPLALWLWLLSLILSRDTLWYFTVSWMPRLHLQHHYSALRPS